ncbi:MAG: hypothetical protein ACRBF0_20735 [Calditrichia bacterium]
MMHKISYRLLLIISPFICTAFFIACQETPAKDTPAVETPAKEVPVMVMSDMDRLQGVWEGQGPGGPCTITISNDTLTYRQPSENKDNQFWYETVFTLIDSGMQRQLHATITRNNSNDHIGSVVVNIFQFKSDSLFLGVLKSFEEPPAEIVTGGWNTAMDKYDLKRVKP